MQKGRPKFPPGRKVMCLGHQDAEPRERAVLPNRQRAWRSGKQQTTKRRRGVWNAEQLRPRCDRSKRRHLATQFRKILGEFHVECHRAGKSENDGHRTTEVARRGARQVAESERVGQGQQNPKKDEEAVPGLPVRDQIASRHVSGPSRAASLTRTGGGAIIGAFCCGSRLSSGSAK
jgi:hypothetical protein